MTGDYDYDRYDSDDDYAAGVANAMDEDYEDVYKRQALPWVQVLLLHDITEPKKETVCKRQSIQRLHLSLIHI